MAFDPQRAGWPCRTTGSCDGQWFTLGDARVCQCRYPRCRRVIAVVTGPALFSPRVLDALQGQAQRVRSDFDGCVE